MEVHSDGNILEDNDLERALRNSRGHANVVLEPQIEFSASQVRSLKEFYQDFFDSSPATSEAKALGQAVRVALQELMNQLSPLTVQSSQYPFLNVLMPVLGKLKEISVKPYTWYLTEFPHREEELLDLKEQVIDPVRKFMSGSQKDIFDNAQKFMQEQESNFSYIEGHESAQVIEALDDPKCFKGNHMKQVKTLVDTLQKKLTIEIKAEITQAKDAVNVLKDRLCGLDEFAALPPEQQEQITQPFSEFSQQVERQKLIAVIRDNLRRFEEKDYPRLLAQMTSWATPSGQDEHTSTPKLDYVTIRSVKVSFDEAWLADEADVKRYLDSMREALLAEIRSGKRVQI